uniref:Uncharacterized protein n=1 Tax=Gopherus agassizii TaxID=38772 RepID=A0A452HT17_9SAUR
YWALGRNCLTDKVLHNCLLKVFLAPFCEVAHSGHGWKQDTGLDKPLSGLIQGDSCYGTPSLQDCRVWPLLVRPMCDFQYFANSV